MKCVSSLVRCQSRVEESRTLTSSGLRCPYYRDLRAGHKTVMPSNSILLRCWLQAPHSVAGFMLFVRLCPALSRTIIVAYLTTCPTPPALIYPNPVGAVLLRRVPCGPAFHSIDTYLFIIDDDFESEFQFESLLTFAGPLTAIMPLRKSFVCATYEILWCSKPLQDLSSGLPARASIWLETGGRATGRALLPPWHIKGKLPWP